MATSIFSEEDGRVLKKVAKLSGGSKLLRALCIFYSTQDVAVRSAVMSKFDEAMKRLESKGYSSEGTEAVVIMRTITDEGAISSDQTAVLKSEIEGIIEGKRVVCHS